MGERLSKLYSTCEAAPTNPLAPLAPGTSRHLICLNLSCCCHWASLGRAVPPPHAVFALAVGLTGAHVRRGVGGVLLCALFSFRASV